jgi:hypothetical protein
MSVSVKQKIGSSDARRWNMDQKERFSETLEKKAPGQIESPVVVAEHTKEWPAYGFDRVQRRLVAKITQMPDLVGSLQFPDDRNRKPPVGVSDYGDEHDQFSVYSPAA